VQGPRVGYPTRPPPAPRCRRNPSGNEFVVRLPAALENVEDIMLIGAPQGIEYDDTHTLP
jgi:hypothetical protein